MYCRGRATRDREVSLAPAGSSARCAVRGRPLGARATHLVAHRRVLLLPGGVEDVEQAGLIVDRHLLPVRVLDGRVVLVDEVVLDELDGERRLADATTPDDDQLVLGHGYLRRESGGSGACWGHGHPAGAAAHGGGAAYRRLELGGRLGMGADRGRLGAARRTLCRCLQRPSASCEAGLWFTKGLACVRCFAADQKHARSSE